MQAQENNSVTPKFSMKQLELNQECFNWKKKLFEFNAPKYFDFFSLPDSPVSKYNKKTNSYSFISDLKIDPWFFINKCKASKQNKIIKRYQRKKKVR